MMLLQFLTIRTFVLAQRTPLNAAFCTVGRDRTLEERRIELPKRSEAGMAVLSAARLEQGRKQCSAVLMDGAQLKKEEAVGAIGRKIPKLWGSSERHNLPTSPKQKSHSANSNPLSNGVIQLLTIFSKPHPSIILKGQLTLISESPAVQRGVRTPANHVVVLTSPGSSLTGGRPRKLQTVTRPSNLLSTSIHHHHSHQDNRSSSTTLD